MANKEAGYLKTKKKRFFIGVLLVVVSVALMLYCRFVLKVDIIFTHFFYIPIIAISIWWGYVGVLAAAGLGLLLLISRFLAGSYQFTEDLLRIFFFVASAYLAGLISNSEKRLVCDLRESEKISTMRESMIYLLVHQLLSPLASFKWSLESIMKEKAENAAVKIKDFLLEARESTEGLISLINDFVNLIKIEEGKIDRLPVLTDISALIKKIISEKEKISEAKNIKISFSEKNMAQVKINPVITSQIIENLLSNAVKYTPEGGKIDIAAEITDGEILFEISDNGYGIPDAEQNKVFEKFFRASNIVKNVPKGAGLGLSIVKNLVELCQGKIRFQSKEDRGTTFYLALPVEK